jgi:hypothetical protein
MDTLKNLQNFYAGQRSGLAIFADRLFPGMTSLQIRQQYAKLLKDSREQEEHGMKEWEVAASEVNSEVNEASNPTEDKWVYCFSESIAALLCRWYENCELQSARDKFFNKYYPSMSGAMWTIAHFSYATQRDIYTVEQSAALWFNECVLPMLKKDAN